MRTYRTLRALVVLLVSPAFAQAQRRDNPTVKETLRWMQTSLESGAGDYSVGHEVRSVRLEDFVGCRVHFSASTHQEPFANGEPAPDKKPTRIDYFFGLGDIDPTNIDFSKGPGNRLDVPSFITIRARNDEKKITSKYSWLPEADARPDDSSLIFALDSVGDNDYVVSFAKAFKHAVEACGGKPSLFADSDGRDERKRPALGGVAAQSDAPRKDIPAIAKAANGAIVSIIMSENGSPIAQGSGFLVSKDGIVVTNYHVIESGDSAVVKLPDGTVFPVDGVLAANKISDLAVIKTHGKVFRTLTLGNSDQLQVGEEVVAIGNPLSLESTVSNGIVSGIRAVKEDGSKYLQTTAPISPGSSGGPLFNMAGDVVGITTMYLKGGENLNFAIPVNEAKRLLLTKTSRLQDLPNEVEPKETQSKETDNGEGSLSQQKMCSEQAEKFVRYKRAQYGDDAPRVEYTSHYDATAGKCYVESTFYFVEGKTYPSGRKYGSSRDIDDASFEGSGGPTYGFFGFPSTDGSHWSGPSCTISPQGRPEIICRSEEEFNDLALKYFGTTPK